MKRYQRILICGLPGSGKTTFAQCIVAKRPDVVHIDGDGVRAMTLNNDFSAAGRIQQANDMRDLADMFTKQGRTVIASFVAPTAEVRSIFGAEYTVFMNTVSSSGYVDTDEIFQPPAAEMRVNSLALFDHSLEAMLELIDERIEFKWTMPSAIMIGRFQPWHEGHQKLFEEALRRYGQVVIYVRCMPESKDNPYNHVDVSTAIHNALAVKYRGKYLVQPIPNTAAVVYGRDVGYDITLIRLPPSVEAISATKIRNTK